MEWCIQLYVEQGDHLPDAWPPSSSRQSSAGRAYIHCRCQCKLLVLRWWFRWEWWTSWIKWRLPCTFWGEQKDSGSWWAYLIYWQPGIPQMPEDTIKTIKDQIWTAGWGVQDAVDKIQTNTRVKDLMANFWILQMIDRACQLQQDCLTTKMTRDPCLNDKKIKGPAWESIKDGIKDVIQQEVFEWVLTQPQERYDCLPQNSCVSLNKHCQSSIFKTHLLVSPALWKSLCPGDHFNVLLRIQGMHILI